MRTIYFYNLQIKIETPLISMKTLIILSALLALSFAAGNNTWATCDAAPADTLIQPLNATIIKNDTAIRLTVHFCGKAKENISVHGASIYHFINDSQFAIGGDTMYSGSLPVSAGQEFCYNVTTVGFFDFPAKYTFRVQLKDDDKNNLNCVNATMIVPPKPTQLDF